MTISVTGGGSVAVTTESLLAAERILGRVALDAHAARAATARVAALAESVIPPASWALRLTQHELAELALDADRLEAELRVAADAYGWVERVLLAEQQLMARLVGPGVTAAVAATAFVLVSDLHGRLTVDPLVVAALRGLADSVDLLKAVEAMQALPGAELEETPVDAAQVDEASVPRTAAAPGGFAQLAARIPPAKKGAPQVRVERYQLPGGENRWVVYVAGTSDWSLIPGSDPWDDTSNLVGAAGRSAGSTRATLAALTSAGWRPGDAVLPVGHSQGGIVATALATSGFAPVPMLVTFGSPTAGVAVPRDVVDVAVEHSDDPVPALGGTQRLTDTRLLVREPATRPAAAARAGALPAHEMTGYEQTARELDESTDERAVRASAALADFTGGGEATVTMWLGTRRLPGSAATPARGE